MGLPKGGPGRPRFKLPAAWHLPIIIVGIAAVLVLGGEAGREWLRYDRSAVSDGEIWRLVSGHVVHLGIPHFLVNTAGLLLIWYLVSTAFSTTRWLWIAVASVAGIDLGFWFLSPAITWYVGLSGLLHGIFAAGVVGFFRGQTTWASVLGTVLAGKLIYEQFVGPLPGSEGSTGGMVIVDAHLYGAIAGALAAWALLIRVRTAAPL